MCLPSRSPSPPPPTKEEKEAEMEREAEREVATAERKDARQDVLEPVSYTHLRAHET